MTTFLSKVLLSAVLVLGATGIGEYVVLQSARHQLSKAEASLTAAQTENDGLRSTLKSTNAALAARAKALAEAKAKLAAARKDLDHAIQENPGWSSTPVPDAVWDSLYGPAPKAAAASGTAGRLPRTATPDRAQ